MNALGLIEFLLKNGSELIRDGIVDEIFVIKTFKSFHSDEDFTNNLSELIQTLATRIADLIENKLLLADERKKARVLRVRFGGVSGGQGTDAEKEAERHIQEQVDKCAQGVDPRYGGFSSEDYMREQEAKRIEQKFVGSMGKDDDQVEQEIKQRNQKGDRVDTTTKKKRNMPKPPSKKTGGSLRQRLGLPRKKEERIDPEEEDVDFLMGSAKKEGVQSVMQANVNNPNDLVDLTASETVQTHEQPPADLVNPGATDDTDLIDFGVISSVSNTGQSGQDVDLLVDLGGGKGLTGHPGTGGTQAKPQLFSDINNDLLDLTGLSLGGPVTGGSSSGQRPYLGGVQSTGMSSANPRNPNVGQSNAGGFRQPPKKDLNINEFDFI